jgi:hypothetical protein
MKSLSIFLFVAALGLSACQDNRVPSLEKRVSDLETKMKAIEDDKKARADADAINESSFKQCIFSADEEFSKSIHLNGSKNANGSYAVPTATLQQMNRQKETKYEECKLLYK